ncbi:MAG: pSer/pThr/pTyr-binding forkhead associated (FHA) protein [Myxococcota bacterium]|jgi:pSer/pThr/pTyr-binding forkhead associated (FHA) protein
MFTLIIEDKDGAIADEYSFEEGEFIVGRSHSSDIILPSDNVSRRHARLYTQAGRCYIEDLNSSNGVFVNGKRIHRVFEIQRSAQIKVGDYYLHVEGASYGETGDPERDVEAQQGGQAAGEMGVEPAAAEEAQIYGRMVGTNLSTQGKPFDIMKPVNLVGRGKDCAITIIDQSVSRIHAKVLRGADGRLAVEDLRSSNGTYVNDERVNKASFGHGDKVRFGNVEFICEMPGMGDVEVVEVSSGGRKGLIALIVFLLLVVVGGSVTVFALRDKIWADAPAQASEEEVEKAREARVAREAEERKEQVDILRKDLERIAKRAGKLAGKDKWSDAEAELRKGAEILQSRGNLDAQGELTAWFEAAEDALRTDRRDYEDFVDAFEEEELGRAGRIYAKLVKRKGAHRLLAKAKVNALKEKLVSGGDLLCANKVFDKCLKQFQKAKQLDPTDKTVSKRVAQIRLQMSSKPPEEKTP